MSSNDICVPKIITTSSGNGHNNNSSSHNHNHFNDSSTLGLPKKKWVVSSLSSLNEVGDYDDDEEALNALRARVDGGSGVSFGSSDNLGRAVSPPPQMGRRDSVDTVLKEAKQKQRRKSWHVGKFEKKRRKGSLFSTLPFGSKESSGSTSPTGYEKYEKQKRNSWWNVFVPDNWPRYVALIFRRL
ncbi:hypothetical protein V9T40_006807 [Parthenolecanium corni]|uniref:Uncharacterized protein n=1 Tax=Parthenolecanium corni TaxID=536013 RepID=A0AAN9TRM4_9HEMI